MGRTSAAERTLGPGAPGACPVGGVFKPDRLERYVKETVEEFLPRLKAARRKFASQEAVFENIKHTLINQLQLIDHIMNPIGA